MSAETALSRGAATQGQAADDLFPWDLEAAPSVMENDTWLLSFIDVLTLLLALFVLLLAQEHQHNRTPGYEIPYEKPAEVVSDYRVTPPAPAPAQVPVLQPFATIQLPSIPQIVTPLSHLRPPSPGRERKAIVKSGEVNKPLSRVASEDPESIPASQQVRNTLTTVTEQPENPQTTVSPASRLLEQLHASGLTERIDVQTLSNSLRLDIADSILFSPARTSLTEDGIKLLADLAATLQAMPWSLSVEGHTDNVPIKTPRFPSNWELSTARASSVARELVHNGVPADRIRAIGYADTRPRASNDTAEGRNRNRRVTFVLELPGKAGTVDRTISE